jgi:hypothetical protein
MALVRFSLSDLTAFTSQEEDGSARHFCVACSHDANSQFKLIPYLNDHLRETLGQYGQDVGAAMLCDLCGKVIATHYPDDFWQPSEAESQKEQIA